MINKTMFRGLGMSVFFLLIVFHGKSQQLNTINLIHQQLPFLNPAGLATSGNSVFADYRKQWAGFTNSPEQLSLLVQGGFLQNKIGLGLVIDQDKVGMLNRFHIGGGFRHKLKFSDNHYLNLGLQIGVERNLIDFSRIEAHDPSEVEDIQSSQSLSVARTTIGAHYHVAKFNIGISASFFLGRNLKYSNPVTSSSVSFSKVPFYSCYLNRPFKIGEKWKYTPSIILISTQGLPIFINHCHTFDFDNRFDFGLGHRQTANLYLHAGIMLWSQIKISYVYQQNFSNYSSILSNTHELGICFQFKASKESGSTSSSSKSTDNMQEQIDQNEIRIQELNRKLDSLQRHLSNQNSEIESIRKEQVDKGDLEKMIRELKNTDSTNSAIKVTSYEVINVSNDANLNNLLEDANATYHIVLGAFRNMNKAQELKKVLKRDAGIDARLISIILSDRTMYMVTINEEYKELKKATKDLIAFRKEKRSQLADLINGEVWILKMKK